MSISVDHFYWVLYETLLKPIGLDCRYQYPFNSGNVVVRPFDERTYHGHPGNRNHAFFHYDQEPIYEENEIDIHGFTYENYMKSLRIFANSELSSLKKKICKRYQLTDWYYFYHGFAALDWYRDAEYVNSDAEIVNAFSSYNHIIRNKRSYRMSLTARLAARDILELGSVSFHGDARDCFDEINDPHTQLSTASRRLIDQYLIDANIKPLTVDYSHVDGSFSAKFGGNMYYQKQRSFLHLVNETVFYDRKLHLTEKIFHPIVHLRPFILVSSPGNLKYLKSYGFKTFEKWIDESYDEIDDDDQRLDLIADETKRIASKPIAELKKILEEMRPVVEFNKKHLFGNFRKIIANELVDNFESCLRTWNNGRVDGRNVDILSDKQLAQAKELLSR